MYVLTNLLKRRDVYVFDQHAELHRKFPLREVSLKVYGYGSLTVSDHHQVFVLVEHDNGCQVEVYDTDGGFVRSFGRGILVKSRDITAANNDRVMVLDSSTRCVQVFSAQGDHLHQFTV